MKAMSKFFLIVSGILIGVGIIVMIIGAVMANATGVQLFQQKVDGQTLYELDLSDKDTDNISIDATNADINVLTGEDKNYIEFINFNSNYYSINTTNKLVSFKERVNISNMFSFWDGNFSFKGMRAFLNLGGSPSGRKVINIHLKDTTNINKFDFTITSGKIKIENTDSGTDYKITMGSGSVLMNNVKTKSTVKISGNDCTLDLKDCSIYSFEANVDNINMTSNITDVQKFELNGYSGSVNAALALAADECDVSIKADLPFTLNSEVHNSEYSNIEKNKEAPEGAAVVHVNGNGIGINLNIDKLVTEKGEDA